MTIKEAAKIIDNEWPEECVPDVEIRLERKNGKLILRPSVYLNGKRHSGPTLEHAIESARAEFKQADAVENALQMVDI